MDFWERLDNLVSSSEVIIDRPKGSMHPRYPAIVYPLDYGYLKGVSSSDGNELDVWRGSMQDKRLIAVICTVDILKKDAEVKLLIGCTDEEIDTIDSFFNENNEYMSGIIIKRDKLHNAYNSERNSEKP
ncbi:inorganic pyrophosphatase [Chloroflexota bacterium]